MTDENQAPDHVVKVGDKMRMSLSLIFAIGIDGTQSELVEVLEVRAEADGSKTLVVGHLKVAAEA